VGFWTPATEDGDPVFARVLDPLGQRVWDAVSDNLAGGSLLVNRSDVVQDAVLRCSAILTDPIYRRFSSLREAHCLASQPFHFAAFEESISSMAAWKCSWTGGPRYKSCSIACLTTRLAHGPKSRTQSRVIDRCSRDAD